MVCFPKLRCWLLAGVAACAAGCDEDSSVRETFDRGVRKAKRTVVNTVRQVREEVQLAGEIELSLNPPVKSGACYASLIVVDAQRPSVLQVTSYSNSDNEKFPSVFMRAMVQPTSGAELAGKTVAAQMFVQHKKDGPIWHSLAPEHAQLRIDEAAKGSIKATIVGGQLVSTETGEAMDVSGTFSGSLK
jgi:hypothetical protein